MRLIEVRAPGSIASGQAFELTILHSADAAGQSVVITAEPSSTFGIAPPGATLEPGGSTTVTCTVTRKESDPHACLVGVRLGESRRFAAPEVT